VSDAEPMSVHLGMLFLGAKVAEVPDPASIDFSLTTNGTPIQVEWKTEGDADWRKVDQLIAKEASDEVIRMPVWNYNGSWTFNGTFLAQRDRSIVSIIADRDALVNNQHKDRENDDFWVPKTPADWKIGTEVRIRLRLLKPEKTPNAKQSGDVKTKP